MFQAFQPRPDQVDDRLYVVTVVFNPARYRSRWRLYRDFERVVANAEARLLTVEVAYGQREFAVTEADNPWHLQLRTDSELWLKENALNLAIQRLPADWQYVAWVDADLTFTRGDWANETVHQLQHYDVVQLFDHAVDLGPDFQPLTTHTGFVWAWQQGQFKNGRPYEHFHPGYAWAARRSALSQLGGLLDTAILGSADRHMAMALVGDVNRSYPPGLSAGYTAALRRWQARATGLRRNVGVVTGTLYHYWHGPKAKRGYRDRWRILVENKYDPDEDLKRDWQGLWQLVVETPRQQRLRDEIRAYFRSRNEDSVDVG